MRTKSYEKDLIYKTLQIINFGISNLNKVLCFKIWNKDKIFRNKIGEKKTNPFFFFYQIE